MKLDDDDAAADHNNSSNQSRGDLFDVALAKQAHFSAGGGGSRSGVPKYRVLQLDQRTLLNLKPSEVFIVKYPTPAVRHRYYKNMIPEIKIHLSPHCRRFFHEDEFELAYLQHGHCPCCRVKEWEAPENQS